MATTVIERPLISRSEVLAAADPATDVSDRTFRRLQAEGYSTRGVAVRPRSGGRARGTSVLFSTLNRDALALQRRGLHAEARRAALEAGRLEERVASIIARGAGALEKRLGAGDQEPWRVFADLWPRETRSLSEETQTIRQIHADAFAHLGLLLRAGRVGEINDLFAEVTETGDETGLIVALEDLRRSGLDQTGSEVFVRLEELPHGRLVTVEPALPRGGEFNVPRTVGVGYARFAPDDGFDEDTEDMSPALRALLTPVDEAGWREIQVIAGRKPRFAPAGPIEVRPL